MAGALAAYYRKVPDAHVEAGLRSHKIDHPGPEEVTRKIIGTIAALHFAPTETSAAALRAENVAPDAIHITGNTVIDALQWVSARIDAEPALASGLADLEARFAGKRIIGVTSHRRENFGGGLEAIAEAIRQIAERPDVALIFPVHPNPNVRKVMEGALSGLPNVALIEPLDYPRISKWLEDRDASKAGEVAVGAATEGTDAPPAADAGLPEDDAPEAVEEVIVPVEAPVRATSLRESKLSLKSGASA
jgi:UDP-N-acetylglucosamine 2-epimerase (non-hydrolysing)